MPGSPKHAGEEGAEQIVAWRVRRHRRDLGAGGIRFCPFRQTHLL